LLKTPAETMQPQCVSQHASRPSNRAKVRCVHLCIYVSTMRQLAMQPQAWISGLKPGSIW